MTPFDATALLAMLRAFYPTVGPAALVRAHAERPEYFAGGVLIGKSGDAMRLPDGRVFDLIYKVLSIDTAWQVLLVGGGAGASDDPFALDDGPIVGIDISAYELVGRPGAFEPFIAGELVALSGTDNVLGASEGRIAAAASSGSVHGVNTSELDSGDGARVGALHVAHAAIPDGVLAETIGRDGVINANESTTDFNPPPYHSPSPPHNPPDPFPPSGPGQGYTDPITGEDKLT